MFTGLIPELRPFAQQLVMIAGSNRLQPRVTSTRRSFSTQARLYKLYLSGRSAYPVAPPGTSAHEFGYAFDVIVTPLEYLNALGSLWESWGGKWGGRFRDPVHFEYPGFTAPTAKEVEATFGEKAFDIAVGFIPGVGEIETLADLLRLFPALSQSQALKLASSPHLLRRFLGI